MSVITTESPELLVLADQFPAEEQEAIARVAGVTVEHPAFRTFLGMAQHYGLNPLLGEIFLIETDAFDRASGSWVTELRPSVGRDGFFKIARRDENVIIPPRSNVVCANDDFKVVDKGGEVEIEHVITLAKGNADSEQAKARGDVLGAWALLRYRDGTPPFFYYAPIEEHGKKQMVGEDGADATEEWIGAWSYTHAMSAKSAQSYVTRIGAQITGVVPADEIRGGTKSLSIAGSGRGAAKGVGAPDNDGIVRALDVPSAVKEPLVEALRRVNALSPFSWATAKVAIVTDGADEAKVRALIEEINVEISRLGGEQVTVGA